MPIACWCRTSSGFVAAMSLSRSWTTTTAPNAGRRIWSAARSHHLGRRLRHLKFAAAAIAEPWLRLRLPGNQRTGLRHLHSARDRLRRAEFAGSDGDLWRRRLFAQPRTVTQHCGFDRRLVRRLLVVEMDILGYGLTHPGDADLHRRWHAAPTDKPRAVEDRGLGGNALRQRRVQRALCRPRSGQPARLGELRTNQRAVAWRHAVARCLRHS